MDARRRERTIVRVYSYARIRTRARKSVRAKLEEDFGLRNGIDIDSFGAICMKSSASLARLGRALKFAPLDLTRTQNKINDSLSLFLSLLARTLHFTFTLAGRRPPEVERANGQKCAPVRSDGQR